MMLSLQVTVLYQQYVEVTGHVLYLLSFTLPSQLVLVTIPYSFYVLLLIKPIYLNIHCTAFSERLNHGGKWITEANQN